MQHEAIPVNGAHGRYGALRHVGRVVTHSDETVAEEVPVALVYNGISHAVMMATPVADCAAPKAWTSWRGVPPPCSHPPPSVAAPCRVPWKRCMPRSNCFI